MLVIAQFYVPDGSIRDWHPRRAGACATCMQNHTFCSSNAPGGCGIGAEIAVDLSVGDVLIELQQESDFTYCLAPSGKITWIRKQEISLSPQEKA